MLTQLLHIDLADGARVAREFIGNLQCSPLAFAEAAVIAALERFPVGLAQADSLRRSDVVLQSRVAMMHGSDADVHQFV